MHVRHCECEDCLPGFPVYVPPPPTPKRERRVYASQSERNRAYYLKRKLREAGFPDESL